MLQMCWGIPRSCKKLQETTTYNTSETSVRKAQWGGLAQSQQTHYLEETQLRAIIDQS